MILLLGKEDFHGGNYKSICPQRESIENGQLRQLTYHTKGLSSKAQPSLPSSVATAASCRPDTDDVLQSKHHNHHKLLFKKTKSNV